MTQQMNSGGLRVFLLIWAGQVVSLVGSGLTSFALGVWVYQGTGSVLQFALIQVCTVLPMILVSPLAGVLVDRHDRRRVMMLGDAAAGACTLVIALLFVLGHLSTWHIYLLVVLKSAFGSIQRPAYTASISLLVPQRNLGRANGMVQLGLALSQVAAPLLGALLLAAVGLEGVLLIDVASFLFALGTLGLVRFPRPEGGERKRKAGNSLWRETALGWRYLRGRPGLMALLVLFFVGNFFLSIVSVLVTPYVLAVASAAALGTVLTTGGVGMLLGSLVMSAWGGPKSRIYGVLGAMLLEGFCITVGGLHTSVLLFAAAAFGFFFAIPIDNSCGRAIFQSKVPADVQGRVFAVTQIVTFSALPLGSLLAGVLADHVFAPLLVPGGPLADSVGQVLGVGKGRGIGLLFVVLGGCMMLLSLGASLYPRLRHVESEVPDGVPADAGMSVAPTAAG